MILHPKQLKITLFLVGFICLQGCLDDDPVEQIEQSVQGHFDADLSDKGRFALVSSILHGASYWDLQNKERLYNWNHQDNQFSQIDHVSLSANGRIAITNVQTNLVFWSGRTGQSIDFWQLPSQVNCIDQNNNGALAIVGMENGASFLIDVVQKGFLHKIYMEHSISACALDEKSGLFALGSEAGLIEVYRFSKPIKDSDQPIDPLKKILTLSYDSPITHIQVSDSRNILLLAAQHDRLQIHDLTTQEILVDEALRNASLSTSYLNGDDFLMLGYSNRTVELRDVKTFDTVKSFRIAKRNPWKPQGVFIQALSMLNNRIYVTSSDGITSVFDN